MKKNLSLLFLALVISFVASAQQKSGIKFTESASWKEIVKKAKAEKKLIFMDAYTTWCGPCKMLKTRVFPDKALGEFFNANFINAAIDMETEEGEKLATTYEVQGYPSLFFINPNDGKVVKMFLGYTEAKDLLDAAKKIIKKKA